MYDQILMLLFKFKEDVKGQRYNINDNQILCDYLCTDLICHQHYSLELFNKGSCKLHLIPSVWISLSVVQVLVTLADIQQE